MENKEIKELRNAAVALMKEQPELSYGLLEIAARHRPELERLHKLLEKAKSKIIKKLPYRGHLIASRTDGLMARINSMIHGVILSDYHDVPFLFSWATEGVIVRNEHCCIDGELPDFFEPDFVAKHHVDEDQILACNVPWIKSASNYLTQGKVVQSIHAHEDFANLLEEHSYILPPEMLRIPDGLSGLTSFSSVFERMIKPTCRKQFEELAARFDCRSCIAIHYRGGDVIYGGSRYGRNVRHRSLSLPVIEDILRNHPDQPVLLFGPPVGETLEEIKLLASRYPRILLSFDLVAEAELHDSTATLCDAWLMSCCRKIYCAGGSNVTRFAQLMTGVKIVIPDENEQRGILLDAVQDSEFENYTALQQAFVYYNLFHLCWDHPDHSFAEVDAHLEQVFKLDPENQPVPLLRYLHARHRGEDLVAAAMKPIIEVENYRIRSGISRLPFSIFNQLESSRYVDECGLKASESA